jgi:hypothetical protein
VGLTSPSFAADTGERGRWWAATGALTAGGGLAAASVALGLLNRHYQLPAQMGPSSYLLPWGEAIAALVWAACGWYLTTRRPGVIFGPVALVTGLAHGLAGTGLGWAVLATYGHHRLPAPAFAMWLWGWAQPIDSVALALIVTLFPEGRRPGGLAGWLGLTGVLICVLGVLHTALEPNPLKGTIGLSGLHNPLGAHYMSSVATSILRAFELLHL